MILVVLVVIYLYNTSEHKSRESATVELAAVGLTQTIGALQAVSVVTRIPLDLPQPLRGVFEFFRIFAFDIQGFVELGCIANFSPTAVYVVKTMILPVVCVNLGIIHVVYCLIRKVHMCQRTGPLISTIGILTQALYTSICALVLLPLQCEKNPSSRLYFG